MHCLKLSAVTVTIMCCSMADVHAGHLSGNHSHKHPHEHSHSHKHSHEHSHGTHAEGTKILGASAQPKLQLLHGKNLEYVDTVRDVVNAHQQFLDSHEEIANTVYALDDMDVGDLLEYEQYFQDISIKVSTLQNVISAQKAIIKEIIEESRQP
jgi:hypothetical protein